MVEGNYQRALGLAYRGWPVLIRRRSRVGSGHRRVRPDRVVRLGYEHDAHCDVAIRTGV